MYLKEDEREVKEDTTRPALERVVLWIRWDKIVNMTASEIRAFRDSDLGQKVGLSRAEADSAGLNVLSGQDASKIIEKMITKAVDYRKQSKKLPPWSKEEWGIAGRQIGMVSRFRDNIGDLEDEEGNLTPKAGAMMLWGRDELHSSGKWPDKDEIKEEQKKLYKKMKEEQDIIKDRKKKKEKEEKESEKLKQKQMNKKKPLHEDYHGMANYLLS